MNNILLKTLDIEGCACTKAKYVPSQKWWVIEWECGRGYCVSSTAIADGIAPTATALRDNHKKMHMNAKEPASYKKITEQSWKELAKQYKAISILLPPSDVMFPVAPAPSPCQRAAHSPEEPEFPLLELFVLRLG